MTSGTANLESTTTSQPLMDSNIKSSSPPPAYEVLPPDLEPPATSSQTPPVSLSSPSPYQPLPTPDGHLSPPNLQAPPQPFQDPPTTQTRQPHFGPTPISSQHPLLPYAYYESLAVADIRARRRF